MSLSRLLFAAAVIGLVGYAAPTGASAQAKKPTVMKHEAEGRTDCLKCHATATDSTKAIPADHANRPNESCQLCHAKDATVQTKDAPAFKHSTAGKTNCLMCHNGKNPKAPATPAESHKGAMDIKYCQYCHKQAPA